ncbi:MAG: response regulator transcription factor [Fimbriimonadaceae bacterium]
MRVLIVEDDMALASELARTLESERHKVDVVRDGDAALEAAQEHDYAIILLDVMLPGRDGWSVCETLRRRGDATPILMLTARDAIEDRLRGFEGGADDYLPKPFDVRELRARIQSLLRRTAIHRTGLIQIGNLSIDTRARTVHRAGQEVTLTRREFDLLEALARNEGRTLTREVILQSVWDESEATDGAVNFHVASLRRKIDQDFEPKLIQTVHGVGYRLRRPEDV